MKTLWVVLAAAALSAASARGAAGDVLAAAPEAESLGPRPGSDPALELDVPALLADAGIELGQRLGGYQRVALPSEGADAVARAALRAWLARPAAADARLLGCTDAGGAPVAGAARVAFAAAQVVAGTNWVVAFEAGVGCAGARDRVFRGFRAALLARAFEPLPYTGAPIEVASVAPLA